MRLRSQHYYSEIADVSDCPHKKAPAKVNRGSKGFLCRLSIKPNASASSTNLPALCVEAQFRRQLSETLI